ncbi:hypothetical protein ABFB50_03790 [Dehalococcoides sp. THU3]|nr:MULTISPECIES: hypothetical protein [Dehalococcoides]AHB13130.1 hypothetical protein GY50_0347 [Dehalococcoides mccartyi GY50]
MAEIYQDENISPDAGIKEYKKNMAVNWQNCSKYGEKIIGGSG